MKKNILIISKLTIYKMDKFGTVKSKVNRFYLTPTKLGTSLGLR